MENYIVKEEHTNYYLYSCISLIMMSPLLVTRGAENNSLFMLLIGILGMITSLFVIRGYTKRKRQMENRDSYLVKITEDGIYDNPFFGQERLIKWSDIHTVKKDICLFGRSFAIKIKDIDDFYSRNKKSLRLIEKITLKWLNGPYRVSLYAADISPDEIVNIIKSRLQ